MSPFELKESLGWFPPLPKMFHADYELGNYSQAQIEKVMWKYLVRKQNCSRAWLRIHQHAPETLSSEPLDILELSTAHGAQLEIWRSLGHNVKGTDFSWATADSMATLRSRNSTSPPLVPTQMLCSRSSARQRIQSWGKPLVRLRW